MDEFWSSIKAIAAVEASSVLEIGQIIDLFLDLVGEHWDFLVETEPIACAQLLLNSVVRRNPTFSRQRLLGCLGAAINKPPQWACFLATVLGTDDLVVDQMTSAHLHSLVGIAWMYRYTDERCLGLYLQLLFVLLMRRTDLELDPDLQTAQFAKVLLGKLCESETDDQVGLPALKLLSAINHRQSMARSARSASTNSVMDALRQDVHEYHRFGERVIWHFNRHRSATSQVLTLKLLYQILSHEELTDILYFNDLKVLLDILLREITNASHDESASETGNRLNELYLLVLLQVLNNKALAQEPYKRGALVRALRLCLESTTDAYISNLVNECLRVKWLGWNNTVHVSPHDSRDNLVLATRVDTIVASPFEDTFESSDWKPEPEPEPEPEPALAYLDVSVGLAPEKSPFEDLPTPPVPRNICIPVPPRARPQAPPSRAIRPPPPPPRR